METLLTLIAYLLQFSIIVFIAWLLSLILNKTILKKINISVLIAGILIIELLTFTYLCENPIFICDEKYSMYINDTKKKDILSYNRGIYSKMLPLIPVVVKVKNANSNEIIVNTYYLFFGVTEMSITSDGPSINKNIFG